MHDLDELIRSPAQLDQLRASVELGRPSPPLRCAKIKLTSRCNLRCTMCRYGRTRSEDQLPAARWRAVLPELAALGCRKLHFSGGEVFLYPHFLQLAELAAENGLKVNLTTNGTLVTKETARRLARIGVHSVSLSLDGPSAKTHDAIRGVSGAFKRTLRALRWLTGSPKAPKVRINVVLMRRNYRFLPALVRLAGELGAHELLPMTVDEKGPRRNRLSPEQILDYNRNIAPHVLEMRRQYGFSTAPALVHPFGVTAAEMRASAKGLYARGLFDRQPCYAPWLHAFFAWDGQAYLCCMTNGRVESLGQLARQSVAEIYHGAPYQRIRQDFREQRLPRACQRCDLFPLENARLHEALTSRPADLGSGLLLSLSRERERASYP